MTPGWFVALACGGLAVGLSIWMLVRTSRSIARLRRAAVRLSRGDLSQRIDIAGPPQVAALAQTLNQMASQLQDRLSTVVRQRNELGALLSSMREGVIAIDLDERLISLNRAASELLQIDPATAIGRSIQEVVRNAALQAFVTRTLRENTAVQSEIMLRVGDEPAEMQRHVEVQSAILSDAGGERLGAVLVLHDVTQLRRLESVRRDFVANVSHEVKTPVAAIKAAVETLLDGARHDPDDACRFLDIVSRQADRLDAIVEDLLSLARIEQDQEAGATGFEAVLIAPILHASCETCQAKADDKRITLSIACDPALEARMNTMLIEQAVVNLVDNAVKYSPPDTTVSISAERNGVEVILTVADQGRGIEPEHLPRIFERFYRTDRARSRELGGTGLGLSIVKHIAETHGGRVSVDSAPGSGSTFRIHLRHAKD